MLNRQDWLLLSPGNLAICRRSLDEVPAGARLASASELFAANLGRPFPWGAMPTPAKASGLWQEHRIGYGGLYHDRWFITEQGRFGGALNVPTVLPGALRSSLLYDGGDACDVAENEGFAVVMPVSDANRDLYRKVQMHAAEHVVADGGHIIISPLDEVHNHAYVGFVGRCQTCPNPEMISFRQLKAAVPEVNFELFDEWKNWSLVKKPPQQEPHSTIALQQLG